MTKGTSNNMRVLRLVCGVVLAAASIAGLAGCPEHPGGGGGQDPAPQQNNLPHQTVNTPAK
jgi:hypothetical protein